MAEINAIDDVKKSQRQGAECLAEALR